MNQTNQQHTDLTPLSPAETMRHSVFLADTRQVVNTTLRRAEEIRYAADIELAGRSRDNYFALERMDTSVPDMTRSALGQASKAVFGTGANMVLTLYRELKAGAESAKLAWEKSGEVRAVTDALRMGTMAPERANRELAGIDARYEKLKSLGRDAMQVMRANHERFLQESGLAKDEQDGFVYDFFGGIATLGAAVAVTAITKSPVAASALFGAYAGRQDYEEALASGVTPGRAMLVGFAGGLAEGGLEHLGLGALEKVFKDKGILRAGLKGFTTEAVQEGSQQTAEEIIMQTFGGREKELQDTFVDITYSALLGGLTGAPVSVIMNFAQKRFEEKGADAQTAQKLAKIAVEHAGSEPVLAAAHDVLRNVTSPLNYPNADVSQGAKEFGAAVRGAQDRNVRRAVYNVAERTEQNALAAGYDTDTAELLGQLEQSRANSIYALAGITPGAQMDLTEVRFEKITPQQTQEDLTAAREQWKREYEEQQARRRQEEQAADKRLEQALNEQGLTEEDFFFQENAYQNGKADTHTPQFKKWFGNSKVVDEKGAPLVVYHGTKTNFDTFMPSKDGALGQGMYFVSSKEYAQGVGKNVMPVYLSIKNPYIANGPITGDAAEFTNKLKQQGYDGVIHPENGFYVAFEPTQIKSVYNRGTFDTSNADIYYKEDLSGPAGSNDIFSVPIETAEKFRTDVKNALQDNSIPKGKTLDMGEIPHIYVKLGLPAGRLKTNKTTLLKAIGNTGRHPHNVPVAVLENLPTLLADPKAIFKSSPDSTNPDGFVVVLDAVNEDGKPIVAIISPSKKGGKGFWFIPSVYDRNNFENFVWKTYTEQGIKYIKEKGSDIWGTLQSRPRHNQNLLNSIKTKEDFVKAQAETYNQGPRELADFDDTAPADAFVLSRTGHIAHGIISPELAAAAGIAPGEIRVYNSLKKHLETVKSGEKVSRLEQLYSLGYDNIIDFIDNVMANLSSIQLGSNNSLLLTGLLNGKYNNTVAIRLEAENGYYKVTTVIAQRKKSNKKTVWEAALPLRDEPGHPALVGPNGTISIAPKEGNFKRETYYQDQKGTSPILDSGAMPGMTAGGSPTETRGAGVRGSITFDKNANTAIIRAFGASDRSTALHEFAHLWSRDLFRFENVSREEDFLQLLKDIRAWRADSYAEVVGFIRKTGLLAQETKSEILAQIQARGGEEYVRRLAYTDELDAQDFTAGFVRRAFEEHFAESFEAYVMRGKAPSARYESLFAKFARWLRELYDTVAGKVEISPAVQSIFDRMMTREAARVDSNLFTGKVEQIKKLVQNIRAGKPEADGAPSLQDFKGLLEMLDAPAPRRPQTHLLKELRRRGAEYKNAGQIDKEAYKNARVYDKKGGVDDRPDVWLQKLGYMDFDETTPETLAEAYDKIQRALDGEEIYPLGAEAQLAEWNNYKAGIDVLKEVFGGNVREIRATLRAILDLEAKGYRVVEKKDLKHMSLRLDELSRLAERLEVKTKTAQEKETLDKKTLADARRVKRNIMLELEKRQVEGKGELLKKLAAAKTFEQIHLAAEEVLNFLSAAYDQTAEGRAEISRLAVPNTDWDGVKVELLQKYNEVISSADEKLKQAWQTLDEISVLAAQGKILDEAQARAKENAERTVRELGERLDGQYVQAMENTLRNIPHLSPQDVRKFLASYAKKATRYRALNQSQVENFIQTAKNVQEANYKKYMRGKIGAVLSRKTFEKVGTARRAKYTPEALAFLQSAAGTWHGTQESAQQAYEHAVGEIDPNNPPSVWQALENRVLWAKADPGGEVSMADLRALYDDALAAVRGDRAFKRMEGVRKAVREDNLRLAAELSLKNRKLPKGTAAYLLHGGVDLQTFLSICFGKYEVDEFDENAPSVFGALSKIAAGSEEETVPGLRPDFVAYGGTPDVTFIWGNEKKGLQHIALEHGSEILPQVIDTAVSGDIVRFANAKKTLTLRKGNIEAVLSLDENGKQKTWLLTGWDTTSEKGKKKRTGANGQVSTDSAATQTPPTFSRQDLGAVLNNSIAENKDVFKAQTKTREIDFREELAPETNQIEEANFKARAERDILRAVGDAYGLKTPFQIIDKIAEMQKDTVELTNYAYVKDQENGETVATLFKNGKPLTHNKPRKQTVSRFDTLTFWIWNQDHDFVETADGVEDYGLAGRLQYAYGTAQLENLFGRLAPQDIKAAKNLQKLAEKHHAEESLVHQRIYGFPLPKKEFYFPSVTDRTTDEIDMKQEFVQNSKAPSFIKKRVKSRRVIQRVANPVDILRRHLRRAGEFIYNAEKYTELQRVFKQSSMGTAFEEAFGEKDGKKVYAKLLALINQQAPQSQQAKDEFYNAANKLFNGWVKAVMGFKPITGIKQFASSVSFAENMPWNDWAKWFAEGLSKPLETAEFMKRLSPYIQTRYESGGMNEAVARAMASDEISPIASRWNNLTNLMLLNTRLGDKASLIYGGYPYMKYLLDVKKLTPEEAARQFEKQATRTLQSSLRVHLSEGQANADSFAARVFLVFKNQQLQYVRKVAESYAAYKNGEISGAQMAKTAFLYLVLNPMVYTMLGLGFFAVDGDDWGEDLKRLLTSPVSQFFGAYPFGEGVADFFMDNAVSVWKDQKLTVPQKMGLPMFDDIYKDVARMVKTVNADDIAVTDFLPVFLDAAKYTGLPTQTFANMAGGAADLVHGKFARGGLRLAGYTKNRAGKITGEEE